MALNVWVAQSTGGVHPLHYASEVVEMRVQLPQLRRAKRMCLGPVRTTAMPKKHLLEVVEQETIWHSAPIWADGRDISK
jgi:hypothetical protein